MRWSFIEYCITIIQYTQVVWKGRKDQEEIVRESRAAFIAKPLESVNWGRGTEGKVKKSKKVKWSAMWGPAKKTRVMIRGIEPAEGKWKMNLQQILIQNSLRT